MFFNGQLLPSVLSKIERLVASLVQLLKKFCQCCSPENTACYYKGTNHSATTKKRKEPDIHPDDFIF